MAIKWLDAKRLQGTNAERTALTIETSDCSGFNSTSGAMSTGYIRACKITASSSYTVTHLKCNITSPSGNVKMCLYSDNSDNPDLLLANTGSKTALAGLSKYALSTPYAVSSCTDYWVSFQSDYANSLAETGGQGATTLAYRSGIDFATTLSPYGTSSDSTTGIQFCTSASSYPNLPNGTIFNETDTYKYFMFDGTDTWNQMVSS